MTRLGALCLAIALLGCQPADDAPKSDAGAPETAIAADVPGADAAALPVLTAGGETPVIGESNLAAVRAACLASDGRFSAPASDQGFICFLTPPDAGKSCLKSTDCTAECLARSRTCTPITPLLGRHEIFTATGYVVTQCRDG